MTAIRVTQRSLATTTLSGLQNNIARLGDMQQLLSSGKQLNRPSDNPGDAVLAMQFRSDISTLTQYTRNVDDGLGWLSVADNSITTSVESLSRARELVLNAANAGSFGSAESRNALADEVDNIRESLLTQANATYLDRPIFGGTTNAKVAFNPDGSYAGDTGQVMRTASASSQVRVDTPYETVFGKGATSVFQILADVSDHLRNDPTQLESDLDKLDSASSLMQSGLASAGARYNRLSE